MSKGRKSMHTSTPKTFDPGIVFKPGSSPRLHMILLAPPEPTHPYQRSLPNLDQSHNPNFPIQAFAVIKIPMPTAFFFINARDSEVIAMLAAHYI